MKKGLRKVLVLVMAGVMTIAPAMTASAYTDANGIVYPDAQALATRMREKFPTITDEHLAWMNEVEEYDNADDFGSYWAYWNSECGGWSGFSTISKESWAYLSTLNEADRAWLRSIDYSQLPQYTRDACLWGGQGADAADLDAIIARLTGQAAPATATFSPSWKQDAKGWWVENPDGTYLTNQWYRSPASGLWYYMGADGYMLTNTTTPDGYKVNADGVWVQ